jgi:hypothetical protein
LTNKLRITGDWSSVMHLATINLSLGRRTGKRRARVQFDGSYLEILATDELGMMVNQATAEGKGKLYAFADGWMYQGNSVE